MYLLVVVVHVLCYLCVGPRQDPKHVLSACIADCHRPHVARQRALRQLHCTQPRDRRGSNTAAGAWLGPWANFRMFCYGDERCRPRGRTKRTRSVPEVDWKCAGLVRLRTFLYRAWFGTLRYVSVRFGHIPRLGDRAGRAPPPQHDDDSSRDETSHARDCD